MMNYEVGVIQKLLKERLSLELTVFKADGKNLIKTVNFKNINTGKFSNLGVEFAGTFKPNKNLSFNANYSYISMAEPIIATPEQQLFVSGTYKWNSFALNISAQHVQNLYTQTNPTLEINSYTLLNSKVSYTINKYVDVFVKGENLTNAKYYINYKYPMPGILAFGGVNLHF